jgi:alcohol dehydrogenase class IV
MEAARELYSELAVDVDPKLGSLGTQGRAQGFVEAMRAVIEDTGLSPRLRDVGVADSDLDLLASEAMKQERLLINNPAAITEVDARRLYEAAL